MLKKLSFFLSISLCFFAFASAQEYIVDNLSATFLNESENLKQDQAIMSSGYPIVVYEDAHSHFTNIKERDGTNWNAWSTREWHASNQSIAVTSADIPYIAYSDEDYSGETSVIKRNGNDREYVWSPKISSWTASLQSIVIASDGNPVVAYYDVVNTGVVVLKRDGSSWINIGWVNDFALSDNSSNLDLQISDAGILYLAYIDSAMNNVVVYTRNGTSRSLYGWSYLNVGTPYNSMAFTIDSAWNAVVGLWLAAGLAETLAVYKNRDNVREEVWSSTAKTLRVSDIVVDAFDHPSVTTHTSIRINVGEGRATNDYSNLVSRNGSERDTIRSDSYSTYRQILSVNPEWKIYLTQRWANGVSSEVIIFYRTYFNWFIDNFWFNLYKESIASKTPYLWSVALIKEKAYPTTIEVPINFTWDTVTTPRGNKVQAIINVDNNVVLNTIPFKSDLNHGIVVN